MLVFKRGVKSFPGISLDVPPSVSSSAMSHMSTPDESLIVMSGIVKTGFGLPHFIPRDRENINQTKYEFC